MRKTKKMMLIAFVIMTSMMSCNKEELFVESIVEEVINNEDEEEIVDDEEQGGEGEENSEVDTSLPCDFDLKNLEPNVTVIINCIMDLHGETINLPSNVTIVYEGGDIVNGTLNFSDNGIISGELLNSSLTLGGSTPQLKDTNFNFIPNRWGIVEGVVPQGVAKNNSDIIHNLILRTKELGVNTFTIDKLDAYFYQEVFYEYIFLLPSDFNLKMTDNTHLRVFQTNGHNRGNLIMILNATNVTVTGGHLYGDRDEHDYSSGGTHEQGHLIVIKTGTNVKIENVHMSNAIGDGLDVESYRLRNDPLFERGSSNVLITGCTFDSNRRNNLSITDGEDIIVENCRFLNAGIATANSTGTAPRSAIDIEPDIHDYNNPWQLVNRVIIRNNIESGPHNGLGVFTGNDVLVTGNTFENGLAIMRAFNVKITNNSARSVSAGIPDIADPRNYEVSGNTVSNPSGSGIYAANPGVQIFNNIIINSKAGIQLQNLKDANIYYNTIESDQDGINAFGGGNNVIIRDNIINVNRPFFFLGVNSDVGKEITIKNNTVNSSSLGYFQLSNGINIDNNDFNNGIRLEGSTKTIVENNNFVFKNGNTTAINIRGEESDYIKILNNYIENSSGKRFNYEIFGEGNALWGDKDIEINGNELKASGIKINNFNGLSIKNNKFTSNNNTFIDYLGNNSYFENNRGDADAIINHYIQGSNNTIID